MFIIRRTRDLEQSKRIYKFLKNIKCLGNGGNIIDWQVDLDMNYKFDYTAIIYNISEKDYYPGDMLVWNIGNWYVWFTEKPERILKQYGVPRDQWVEFDFTNLSDKLFILNKEDLC